MPEGFGSMAWRDVAEMLQEEIEINWDKRLFNCSWCKRPIREEEWYYLGAELDEKENPHPFCPYCGFCFED